MKSSTKLVLFVVVVVAIGASAYWALQSWQTKLDQTASLNSTPPDPQVVAEKVAAAQEEVAAKRMLESTLVHEGEIAPSFQTQISQDSTMDLPVKGKLTLINFFATWCGPCRAEMPHLDALWKDVQSNEKVQFVVIGRGESVETLQKCRDEMKLSLPFGADLDQKIFASYAREYIPRTVIVGLDGKIIHSKIGYTEGDVDQFRSIIENQLRSLK